MAKKNKKIPFYLSVATIALAAIAILTIVMPAIVWDKMEQAYSGLEVTFGCKEEIVGKEVEVFKFSFMNFLPYLLLIGGIVLTVMNLKGGSGLFKIVSAACFVVAAVLFFMVVGNTVPNSDYVTGEELKEVFEMGAGAIIGAICSILAAGVSVFNWIRK